MASCDHNHVGCVHVRVGVHVWVSFVTSVRRSTVLLWMWGAAADCRFRCCLSVCMSVFVYVYLCFGVSEKKKREETRETSFLQLCRVLIGELRIADQCWLRRVLEE